MEKQAALLQEFLGPTILSSIVPVDAAYVDELRTGIHKEHPAMPIVDIDSLPELNPPKNILTCIDVERSAPNAVRYLAAIVNDVHFKPAGEHRGDLQRVVWSDGGVYDGYAWQVRPDAQLRFLGQAAREAARQARVIELEAEQATVQADLQSHKDKLAQFEGLVSSIDHCTKTIDRNITHLSLPATNRRLEVLATQIGHYRQEENAAQARLDKVLTHVEAKSAALASIEKLIVEQDLESIANRRSEIQSRLHQASLEKDGATDQRGKRREHHAGCERRMEALQHPLQEAKRIEREKTEEALRFDGRLTKDELAAFIESEGVLKMTERGFETRMGQQMKSKSEALAELRQGISRLQGLDLYIDEDQLIVIETSGHQDLQEHINTLNRETQSKLQGLLDKIRRISDDQIIRPIAENLKRELLRMDDMLNDLNKALKKLNFEGRTYRIQKRATDANQRNLANLLREYNDIQYDALKNHLEAIVRDEERDASALMEFFDYRQWYSFSLQAARGDDEHDDIARGGSGGEQAAPHYVLIYAMLNMYYQSQDARLRVIILDEAFIRIDPGNKPRFYKMAKDLELTVIAANTEFEGHSTLKREASVLMFKKHPVTLEAAIHDFHQEKNAA